MQMLYLKPLLNAFHLKIRVYIKQKGNITDILGGPRATVSQIMVAPSKIGWPQVTEPLQISHTSIAYVITPADQCFKTA